MTKKGSFQSMDAPHAIELSKPKEHMIDRWTLQDASRSSLRFVRGSRELPPNFRSVTGTSGGSSDELGGAAPCLLRRVSCVHNRTHGTDWCTGLQSYLTWFKVMAVGARGVQPSSETRPMVYIFA